MPVTITLLNFRESAVPEIGSTQGLPAFDPPQPATFFREYKATFQTLVDGDTRDMLQWLSSRTGFGDVKPGIPSEFSNIIVDANNSMALPNDLHIPTGMNVATDIVSCTSEIIGNYDRSEYGKLAAQVTLDIISLRQYWDPEQQKWFNVPLEGEDE